MSRTATAASNGVDVLKLVRTMEAIEARPALAAFTFRNVNRWFRGAHSRSVILDFQGAGREVETREEPFVLEADEPEVLLGGDRGASPLEIVLHALAASLTTALVYHAAAQGIEIESVESSLEGDLDLRGFLGMAPGVRPGYRQIRAELRVRSGVRAALLEQLVRHSAVLDLLINPVPVQLSITQS